MSIEIVTSWQTLIHYAKELGQARRSGDKERIDKAKKKHDEYRDMCLKSDRMVLPFTNRDM